jgi:hypothetical protein
MANIYDEQILSYIAGVEGTRVHTLEDSAALLDVFQAHSHTGVDTACFYGQGSSEEYLGEIGWHGRGLEVHQDLPHCGQEHGRGGMDPPPG